MAAISFPVFAARPVFYPGRDIVIPAIRAALLGFAKFKNFTHISSGWDSTLSLEFLFVAKFSSDTPFMSRGFVVH